MTGPASNPPQRARSALWSALVPGLGQYVSGRHRRGILFAIPALAGIAAAVWVVAQVRGRGIVGLVEILVRPAWLWTLLVVNAVLAIERIVAVVDAWRHGDEGSRWWLVPAMVVLAAALVPHLLVHRYGTEAISLVDTVFAERDLGDLADRERRLLGEGVADEDLGPPAPTTTVASTALPQTTQPSTTVPRPTTPRASTPIVYPEVTDDSVAYASPLGEQYTVLLAGGDFGPGRQDLRTDVMIVARLDVAAGTVGLISISRELANVPLPAAWSRYNTMLQVQQWHESQAWQKEVREAEAAGAEPPPEPGELEPCDCFFDRINYLHVLTANWVRTFPDAPDPGMEALGQTLSGFLGIDIDAYVLVDFAGFVDLVDALGGVHVTADEAMDVGFSPAKEGEEPVRVDIEPGVNLLDGRQALAYVRNRTGSSDNERMRRQRCMIRELASEADTRTLLFNFPTLARAIRDNTTTTLSLDLLPDILNVLGGLEAGDISTLSIDSVGWSSEKNYLNLPIVDAARVRRAVAEFLDGVATGAAVGNAETECP